MGYFGFYFYEFITYVYKTYQRNIYLIVYNSCGQVDSSVRPERTEHTMMDRSHHVTLDA
jgi:hypothetical protein